MAICRCCGSCDASPDLVGYEMDTKEQQQHQYFKCLSCGAIFLDHVPEFKDYDESGFYQRKSVLFSSVIKRLMDFFHQRRYAYIKSNHKKDSAGRLLDIGCGKGNFLNVARQDGWSVCGIEPTKRSAEYARNEHGIEVIETGLHESNIAADSYDVVTMWHVLEHLSDPRSALNEVRRVLVKGGILIIAVPNIASMQANFGGGTWFHLDPPRHVIHFSPEFIYSLLSQSGFQVEKVHHFSAEYNIIGWFQTIQNRIIKWPNFTFNLLKRNSKALPRQLDFVIGCTCSLILLILFPIIVVVCLFEAVLGKGGTITLVAKKTIL